VFGRRVRNLFDGTLLAATAVSPSAVIGRLQRPSGLREICSSRLDLARASSPRTARSICCGGQSEKSARARRLARTIADPEGAERVEAEHVAEALQYRAYEARRVAVD
jgi:hypothetical protein